MQPKISIIIPVFNVEQYIAECLESCIHQTLKEIEILIVDDCGSDRSIEIAREYASRDSRIKILEQEENFGPFHCRNVGAKEAKADYIMFLDSDDFLDLNACEVALSATENNFYDIVGFGAFGYCKDKVHILVARKEQKFDSFKAYRDWACVQKYTPQWELTFRIIKKEKYLKACAILNLQDRIYMAEDALMSFVLWNVCKTFCHKKEILYYYRRDNMASTTHSNNVDLLLSDYKKVMDKISEISKLNSFDKKLAKLFVSMLRWESNHLKNKHHRINKIFFYFYRRAFTIKRSLRYRKRFKGL